MPIRVSGGEFRGRQIASPLSSKTRPTAAMTREALFNILQDVSGFRVLDLFAGSGIMGIEAISRGAASVTAVEKNAAQARSIESAYRSLGISEKLHLCVTEALRFAEREQKSENRFDLIYADPPFTEAYPDLRCVLPLLSAGGVAVFEVPSRHLPDWSSACRIRRYGESSLAFFYASL